MSNGYFLADTNSLVYACHAGGSRLLDTYLDAAEEQDRRFAITETVRQEIKKGPLGEDLLRYLAEREVPVLSSPETEQRLRAGTLSAKSAGEVSMLEVAQRESEAGRVTRIWSDDKYFDSEQIMRGQPIDFVQISYNVLDRDVEERILPLARERGIGVIVNRPFREGALLRSLSRHPLPGWAGELGCRSWAQLVLKFIVTHPAVTCVIPATTNVAHVRENMAAGSGAMPDEAMRRRIAAHVEQL